ncbi:MAG: M48 family metalloprotease [Ignavibacteria bacterium]|nr:M48 family metalloprotease [Ignavibacteria bacterium]MBI3766468.1 M48 family metalloprotease [Ignavibacteriales bacterium]
MKRLHFFPIHVIIALTCSFTALHCGINIFPDSDDIKLGKQIDEEIRKNPKQYPIMQGHPEVKQYVKEVGDKVLASPDITKRGIYAYQYEIIHDDSTINAFCTPGGYIYVYTGLLKFVDNEATLAGVMGHEIAHAELRHATQRMTSQYGLQAVIGLVLGQNPGQIADITGNLFGGLALLANSRADEAQADEYSIKYLSSTKYFPGAITNFFEKMSEKKGGKGGGGLERFLSTHPLDQDRIDHVNQLLAGMGNPKASDANLFTQRYQTFRKKLP